MKTPRFWYSKNSLKSKILIPLSYLWILGSMLSQKKAYDFHNIKIIKVGNIVAGGAGKTPTVIAIVKILIKLNIKVHIISKGYKGSLVTSTLVNKSHSYKEVGEEAVMLSHIAPTWIGKNRVISIKNAVASGAELVILDDGLQDSSIKGDLNIIVFNGSQGIGNGRIIPAGPLREKLNQGISRCHLCIIIEKDENELQNILKEQLQVINAKINIDINYTNKLKNKNVIAFCGIGYPKKFFNSLETIGCNIIHKEIFPDHHLYDEKELKNLLDISITNNCLLITTQKDHLKLLKYYKDKILYLPITLDFKNVTVLKKKLSNLANKK